MQENTDVGGSLARFDDISVRPVVHGRARAGRRQAGEDRHVDGTFRHFRHQRQAGPARFPICTAAAWRHAGRAEGRYRHRGRRPGDRHHQGEEAGRIRSCRCAGRNAAGQTDMARRLTQPSKRLTAKTVARNDGMMVVALFCAMLISIGSAHAADKVRAGKSIGSLWAFLPLDIGMEKGLFAKYGIEVEISDLGSGAKLQQALASDSIDIGLSAGSDMMASVKGSPVLTVAAFAEEPRSVVIMVRADSPIQKPTDFKGKLVAMPSLGSVSEWLLRRMAIAEGLGQDGVRPVSQ